MKYTKHITALSFLFILSFGLTAAEKKLVLGGDAGWPAFSNSANITKIPGRFGKEAVSISTASVPLRADTDLLLNFENADPSDITGNYKVLSSSLTRTDDTIMGKYAALGKGAKKGLEMRGGPGSMFGRQGPTGSFTLSFWLNPSLAENGESVLSWRSSRNMENIPVYQMIAAAFFNNKIEWTFTNVFSLSNSVKNIRFSGKSMIIPNRWALHTLCFDEETGLLQYFVNGKTEALLYTTSTGRENGSVYIPILGVPAELEICPGFTGQIDDFCIQKAVLPPDYRQARFNPDGAYFTSRAIGPLPPGSRITGLDAVIDTPEQTDVRFFIRAGNNYHTWTSLSPEWIPVENKKSISGVEGIWFQVAAALYTDGGGTKSPSITEIILHYKEKEAPLPPVRVFAEAKDGSVELSWLASAGNTVSGYTVYYGEAPGEYLGKSAFEGASPIDAGNVLSLRLSGLKNGAIYYFAVAAYDNTDMKIEGVLSREVYARPLRGKR
ncbi:hypothetical protein V1L52_00695 [Treponema sp. HNW]|uniref:hypothetical protein n=1 Tax=Treponema sp. HNW TaxID=3116654 RepID=UPI003D0BA332